MSAAYSLKTNFTGGEVSPNLLGRTDLRAYANGAARLRNVFIDPIGGVTRRPGLRYIGMAAGAGRLISFEFNIEQVYLLVFSDLKMAVYRDDALLATIDTPWTQAQLAQIAWTQSADTLLVVHPDVPPRKITRSSHAAWTIAPWQFVQESGISRQPYHKFAATEVTVTPSATAGTITLTASAAVFKSEHQGMRLRIVNKEVEVTAYVSATQVIALCKETLTGAVAVADWEEPAFSVLRGWPVSVTFHQDRLVVGGSRDLPNRLWLSKSSDLFNFDLGEGLDDEAIEFALLSDQVNAIRAVFSGRHLQVFTSGAEWMVSGDPLTPSKIQLRRQTSVGSSITRSVPPREVDGATLFISRNGRELREFLYADMEQAYQANDLAMLARHLMVSPVEMDYDAGRRLLHLVMADGSLATMTNYRIEEVTAWTRQDTAGAIRSVTVCGDIVYVLVERSGRFLIERLDSDLNLDAAMTGTSGAARTTWSGLDHLEGCAVTVLADGARIEHYIVSDGRVVLSDPAAQVQIGLPYTHEIVPLPPVVDAAGAAAQVLLARLVQITFRLSDSVALTVDTGRGLSSVPFRRMDATKLDTAPPRFSGDIKVRAIGWHRDAAAPLWRVEQATPVPCTVLSVTTELKVSE